MKIIKSNKSVVDFDPQKILKTVLRTGIKIAEAQTVTAHVTSQVTDLMTTRQLIKLVKRELRSCGKCFVYRYNLREALFKLGPSGFYFEVYFAELFRALGWQTELPPDDIQGVCTRHEIDVVARRDGKIAMVEAKFRNSVDNIVNLKDVMSTFARFGDVAAAAKINHYNFNEVWIVSNGKFSDRAEEFGQCKKMRMIGWGGQSESIAKIIDQHKLYPITVVENIKDYELKKLDAAKLLLALDLAKTAPQALAAKTGLSPERAKTLINAAKETIK